LSQSVDLLFAKFLSAGLRIWHWLSPSEKATVRLYQQAGIL
jgi:hypothetical protein